MKTDKLIAAQAYLSEQYTFMKNTISNRIEVFDAQGKFTCDLDDYLLNTIYLELNQQDISIGIQEIRSVIHSYLTPSYNPIESYFNSLANWDGHDHIKDLARTVETSNNSLFEKCLRKWLVAMVGCALRNDIVNHTVLVFYGDQGIGKTSWLLRLVPKELSRYVYSGTISPNNKDTIVNLSECILGNLDELENLNKTEIGSLKELITKSEIRIRRPYSRYSEKLMRRMSFTGSVNKNQFLNDLTGTRRFLCFETLKCDYQHKVDINSVMAQALNLLNLGYQHWFDSKEVVQINENNEQYKVISIEEELLCTYFEPGELEVNSELMSTTEIAVSLRTTSGLPVNYSSIRQLGILLNKYDYPRLQRKGRYVYCVRQRNHDEILAESRVQSEDVNKEVASLLS